MVEIRRLVGDLTKRYLTPDFLTRAREDYARSIENTLRAGRAFDAARRGLTAGENRLADEYEVLYIGGQRPNMTNEDEQRLINQISAQLPGAREAYEKKDRLYNEALQE